MNIDEAALKADPSDSEIMEIAGRWFHTGENQHRADGYYYRSLGTPTNVRGSDLIAFARALLQRSQGQEPVAEFGGRRLTPEGTTEFWGVLLEPWESLPSGTKLYTHPAPVAVVPAEQAEDSAMRKDAERYRWLTKGAYIGECFTDAGTILEVHGTDKCVPIYGSVDEAIDAAMSNREAGG